MAKIETETPEILWKDRKRPFLGLPISFTKYSVSKDRLFIQKGFFTTTYDEVRLYRILDLKLTQKLGQKLVGVGTVTVFSSDKAQGEFDITSIKKPKKVKELLSELIEKQREEKRVVNREMMGGPGAPADGPDFGDNDFDDDVDMNDNH